MQPTPVAEAQILKDLGDGLILRRAIPADTEALAAHYAHIFRPPGTEEPHEGIAAWTRDLMSNEHPTFRTGDFTVVEDTGTGEIVSALNLISQTWTYGGIPFGVGRPELVATKPEYRWRGLVRAQFDVIHWWSAERGEMVQAITGIPWYYRQYGYEMTVELGGGRSGYATQVPKLKTGETEPYRIRPATEADLPLMQTLYEEGTQRYLVSVIRDEAMWRYELLGRSEKSGARREHRIIETAAGEPVGYLSHGHRLWRDGMMAVGHYELKRGISWLAVTPTVIRYVKQTGEAYAAREKKELHSLVYELGSEHPMYQIARDALPQVRRPYAWYLRVPDLPGFVWHVAPVLEQRLAGSLLAGHTGELKVSFYRNGLRLVFEQGHLKAVEPWRPLPEDQGNAAFPDLTFLQILFGHRTLAELEYAYADCWAGSDEARALLQTLFPKQMSQVWP
ncbi:MAG: GNAT family N-acetyltransferase, partial [Anaerolineae bacterium]|nr:GNAT family N-acetyltransferase [Anaerolineae bacterium]